MFAGQNPVDIAQAWADPRCLEVVQKRWDSLPAPNDKKGKKGGKKSAGSKSARPISAPGVSETAATQVSDPVLNINYSGIVLKIWVEHHLKLSNIINIKCTGYIVSKSLV